MVNVLQVFPFDVEEHFIASKTKNFGTCEDAIFTDSNHFIAVVDGATSKTDRRWNGETGGRVAARIVGEALQKIPYNASFREAIDAITETIHNFYLSQNVLNVVITHPVERLIASAVIVSLFHNEIWFVGDCQCLLDTIHIVYHHDIDRVAAEARAMFLETEILRGVPLEQLAHYDTGRAFILPLLQRQQTFENNSLAGEYQYAVFDGFPIADDKVFVHKIPDETQTIVLATDGYPILKESLEASEEALQNILQDDPLLFRKYKSTKGMQQGNLSFDDRAYVKLRRIRA